MSLTEEFIHSQGAADELEACKLLVREYLGEKFGAADLMDFAEKQGIEITWANDLPFEGAIERDSGGRARIQLRAGLNRRRERFTLAHELGHWLLQQELLGTMEGQLFRGLSRNKREMSEEEKLANLLAAEILLPRDAVEEVFDSEHPLSSIEQLCRRFVVSRTMTVRRVADVCCTNLAMLQLMPYLFSRLDSAVQIDDAIFASWRKGTLFDRDRTRIAGKIKFSDVVASETFALSVSSPKGHLDGQFQINFRPTPVPHAFAVSCFPSWPSEARVSGS